MGNVKLSDLESTANEAYQAYHKVTEAQAAAHEKTARAEKECQEATNQFTHMGPSPENVKKMQEAQQALAAAKAEEEAAGEAVQDAMADAQAAADAVAQKKEELRQNRNTDTAYVVHYARIECTYGMRESYLALGPTHGVMTRQRPQMTANDTVVDTNIINFGGCTSPENPTLRAAAEEAARKADETIEKETGWGGKLVSFFCGEKKSEVSDSLMAECMGECIACFPPGTEWRGGHKKVSVNGEAVLLRRCSLRCNYGGEITILLSGQPE